MQSVSLLYKFTRVARQTRDPANTVATDALSVISLWRALDGDRCFHVFAGHSEEMLVAEIGYPAGDFESVSRDLNELCAEHNLVSEQLLSS